MRDVASCDILAVWKRAALRNRMRENFTSGSVGGLVEQSPALPGQKPYGDRMTRHLSFSVQKVVSPMLPTFTFREYCAQ